MRTFPALDFARLRSASGFGVAITSGHRIVPYLRGGKLIGFDRVRVNGQRDICVGVPQALRNGRPLLSSDGPSREFERAQHIVFSRNVTPEKQYGCELDRIMRQSRTLLSIRDRLELYGDREVAGLKGSHDLDRPPSVFVVHGRDDLSKLAVARFLEKLDLKAIILHEQPDRGLTIIEKFEHHAAVGFAVVLLTPDDEGGLVGSAVKRRARQNVVFELGFFIGKLGRNLVCALKVDVVEEPSDLHGLLYIPLDSNNEWKLILGRELKAAGIDVDLNKAI